MCYLLPDGPPAKCTENTGGHGNFWKGFYPSEAPAFSYHPQYLIVLQCPHHQHDVIFLYTDSVYHCPDTYTPTHRYLFIHTCACTLMYYIYGRTHVGVSTHMYVHIYVYAHMHTYTHPFHRILKSLFGRKLASLPIKNGSL